MDLHQESVESSYIGGLKKSSLQHLESHAINPRGAIVWKSPIRYIPKWWKEIIIYNASTLDLTTDFDVALYLDQ